MAVTWTWRSDVNGAGEWPATSASPSFSATGTSGTVDLKGGRRLAQHKDAESTFVSEAVEGGKRKTIIVLEVLGEDVETDSELIIAGLPPFVTVYSSRFAFSAAGSASTLDPKIGRVASFTANSIDQLLENQTPAAWVDLGDSRDVRRIFCPDGILVVRPAPNTATPTAPDVKFEIVIGTGF